jgi:hypothetical protein
LRSPRDGEPSPHRRFRPEPDLIIKTGAVQIDLEFPEPPRTLMLADDEVILVLKIIGCSTAMGIASVVGVTVGGSRAVQPLLQVRSRGTTLMSWICPLLRRRDQWMPWSAAHRMSSARRVR